MVGEKTSCFVKERYINLETFKKNGESVRTPVWFVIDGERLCIRTPPKSGKAKRIRNVRRVRVVPCRYNGEAVGEWVEGRARPADPGESSIASRMLNRKYNVQKWIMDMLAAAIGRKYVVFVIEL